MKNNDLFSQWIRRKARSRRRWLALGASCLAHIVIFGILALLNPSLRFETLFPEEVRTVRLSPRLHLPLPEISSRGQTRPAANSKAALPAQGRPKAESPGKGRTSSSSPEFSSATIRRLTASFNLHQPGNRNEASTTSAPPASIPSVYNFSLIPKDIPDEISWLKNNHYQANPSAADIRIISKFMVSSGTSPETETSLLEAVTLPPTPLLYDPALLSPWADQVVTLIQKKWLEFIPRQLVQKRPAHLALEIDRQGHLIEMKLSQTSGDSLFDESLLKAIRMSLPLPPLPPTFPAERIQLTLVFQANEK